jgi:hypothetical protein
MATSPSRPKPPVNPVHRSQVTWQIVVPMALFVAHHPWGRDMAGSYRQRSRFHKHPPGKYIPDFHPCSNHLAGG